MLDTILFLNVSLHKARMSKEERLKEIEKKILQCKRCELYKYAKNKVPGEGNPNANIVFIGEAPGEEEDKQGRPFVGRAGKLLTKLIEEILGIKRENVYITNVLKCRPPNNRDPKENEIKACFPFLIEQLNVIQPDFIVCLGRFAAKTVFEYFGVKFTTITKVRGKPFIVYKWGKKVTLFATLHPAAALYHSEWLSLIEEDFKKLKELIEKPPNENQGLLRFIKK